VYEIEIGRGVAITCGFNSGNSKRSYQIRRVRYRNSRYLLHRRFPKIQRGIRISRNCPEGGETAERLLFNNIIKNIRNFGCIDVYGGTMLFNNIRGILLKSIRHFGCINVYGGTMLFNNITDMLIKSIRYFGCIDVYGGTMLFNNITDMLLKSIHHFVCSDVYGGTMLFNNTIKKHSPVWMYRYVLWHDAF